MLLAINTFAMAQNSSLSKSEPISIATNETLFVHLNNTTLIAGETLHCKLYCTNPTNNTWSEISKIAYVDLVNSDSQVIFSNKIYLDNGKGQGDFFIPTTIETGNYKLIAYTKWMLNKKDLKTAKTDLLLINPYLVSNKTNSASKETKTTGNESVTENSIKDKTFAIQLDKTTFQEREQVALKIKSLTAETNKGSYSLSVKKIDNLPSKRQMNAAEFVKFNTNNELTNRMNDSIRFLPELRGEIISGCITNTKNPGEINHKTVALSIPGKEYAFKITQTNPSGKFNFILDKDPNYSNAVVQIIGNDKNDYKIDVDKNKGYNLSDLKNTDETFLTSDYKSTIEQRSIANQIENAYYSLKKDSITNGSSVYPFYNPLQKEYILGDYTKFPTLKETITEVIKEMYYREKDNNYSLNLRDINYDLEYFSEPALVLVDGLLIQNVNELFTYKTENIYKVSIVPGVYFYGPKAFNGVINFTTKNNDYVTSAHGNFILNTEIQRPQNKIIAFKQNYNDQNKENRIPDYRYQLLWEPQLTLENKENTVSFFTSDVSGKYEISLEGFTENGLPVSAKEIIEVNTSN
ncbi:hypothetical protein SGQ83_15985 [Flavobacterium sp. Fl-318]|uniref:TonB-dependent receptor n=1 Tax=Flavobacterium cupriresistens TaxID=2893885 RepID=A0ABU4RK15_9FLAO|nr:MULTISPECIES: hypothetical protein [unclassified Flavobacterium]MDX6190861.1 hypothetical protein [Flavobacterium sp. Fl-318]UFH43967.1 hypothetical protein LNP23_07045 [Flavobacterium sp. F-323]